MNPIDNKHENSNATLQDAVHMETDEHRPAKGLMVSWKVLAFGMLLLPAMATAQYSGASGDLPVPGASDHPSFQGIDQSGKRPAKAYYDNDQPVPGTGDHPGIAGGMQGGGTPAESYMDAGQPIPGTGDHPAFRRSSNR